MDSFALLPSSERRDIIQERASAMAVDFTIVEKDFWVCWTLKSLFALPAQTAAMTFKGGTSLSKAYGLIDRFSEDIDVVTDPTFFLAKALDHPEEPGLSNTQRERRMHPLDDACAAYIGGPLLTELQTQFTQRLGSVNGWNLTVDAYDRNTLLFEYPQSDPGREHSYIRGLVKIEMGWRAKTAPSEFRSVAPYLAETPGLLLSPQVNCNVLVPDRSFWEKVTALHAESFRDGVRPFFSRHYSDVAAMLQTRIGKAASRDLAMLEDVRVFKDIYYHSARARYDLAKPGTLVVVPGPEKLRDLERDYRDMRQMFLKDPPSFDWVVEELKAFEATVNR